MALIFIGMIVGMAVGAAIVLTVTSKNEECAHHWGNWSEVAGTRVFSKEIAANQHVTETLLYLTQERKCTKCGLIEIKGDCE